MNKKILIGSIAVFVLMAAIEMLVNNVIMMKSYEAVSTVWRPMEQMRSLFWVMYVVWALYAVCFTFIYSRGHEGRGILEGVRYGAVVGVMTSVCGAYMQYVIYPVPYHIVLQWGLYGLAESIILGIALTFIFGKKS